MANVNRINGASPVGTLSGASWNQQGRTYAIATANTADSFAIGDIVMSAGGSDANGVPYVKKIPIANASNFCALGIVVGIEPVSASVSLVGQPVSLETSYLTTATRTAVRYIRVVDDPNVLFEMSAGTTATNFTLVKARYNAGIASWFSAADQTLAIDQTTYLSTSAPLSNLILSSATVNTTNTLPIQMLGLVQRVNNEVGAYSRILCRFNSHEFGYAAGANFTGI